MSTTRASVGYANDNSGNWTLFASNVPRITSLGLLVEESRTNLLINSNAMTSSGWGGTNITATGSFASPDGGTNAFQLTDNSTSGQHVLATTGTTITGGSTYTFSVFLKSGTDTNLVQIGTTFFAWQAQLELGASSTSPIVTAAVSVTRAADVVTLTSPPAIGGAYTLFAQGTPQAPTAYGLPQRIFEFNDGTASNEAIVSKNSATAAGLATLVGGTGLAITNGIWTQNVSGKIALAVTASNQAVSFNGTAVTTGTAATLPTGLNAVQFGNRTDGTRAWNGFISYAALWATQRVPNAQLQAITSGP